MEAIEEFLILNGFEPIIDIYTNNKCVIHISDVYSVSFNDGIMYSTDLNIYWLIGVLTYYDLIERDYKSWNQIENKGLDNKLEKW